MTKRNNVMVRAAHEKRVGSKPTEGTSKYAKKVKRGDQMYGPGCCAHDRKIRTNANEER